MKQLLAFSVFSLYFVLVSPASANPLDPSDGACDSVPGLQAWFACRSAHRARNRVEQLTAQLESSGGRNWFLAWVLANAERTLERRERYYNNLTGETVPGFGTTCDIPEYAEWEQAARQIITEGGGEAAEFAEPYLQSVDSSGLPRYCKVSLVDASNNACVPTFRIFLDLGKVRSSASVYRPEDSCLVVDGFSSDEVTDYTTEDVIQCAAALGCDVDGL